MKAWAREAKAEHLAAKSDEDRMYAAGRLMAYNEFISFMQGQAIAFNIPLEALCLADIDPDNDL
jgi:hypothetical protein